MLMTFMGISVYLTFYTSNLLLHTEQKFGNFKTENKTNTKHHSKTIAVSLPGSGIDSTEMPPNALPYPSIW